MFFRKVFWESVETREKEKLERADLLEHLIKLKNSEQDSNFSIDIIVTSSSTFTNI